MISDGEKPEIAIDQDKIKIFANIIKNFVMKTVVCFYVETIY